MIAEYVIDFEGLREIANCFTIGVFTTKGYTMRQKTERKQTSLRMSARGKVLLEETAIKLGITQAAAIELAVREFAKKNGVDAEERD